MEQGFVYLLTGQAHAARLVVSAWSLRNHFSGPITVYTSRVESHEIGRLLAADSCLRITHQECVEAAVTKNSSFLTKLDLIQNAPYEITAYLDADTLVVGSVQELLQIDSQSEFHVTQFANWVSSGRKISKRVEAWRSVKSSKYSAQEMEMLVDDALTTRPAVNGGVFAFRRGAKLLHPWRSLAYEGWRTFICDEIALQLLYYRYPHRVLDCRFNCSPIYARCQDPRVWHMHGEKHLSRDAGRALWLPAFRECWEKNIARLRDWAPAGDTSLAEVLQASILS